MSAATFEVPDMINVTVSDHVLIAKPHKAYRGKPTKSAKPVDIVVNGATQPCFAREGGTRPTDPGETERYEAETYFRWQGKWFYVRNWNARNVLTPRITV